MIKKIPSLRKPSWLNRAALIAGTIAGGIALRLALLLADRLLKPVQQLTSAARKMAQGDLTQRVTVHGADELAELGLAFNHMAGSLQKAEQNRQAMTADEGKERHFAYVVDEPHHQVAAQARQAHRSVRVPRIQIGEIEIRVGREGMDHRLDGHPVREFQWFEFREGGDHTMALVGNIVIIG